MGRSVRRFLPRDLASDQEPLDMATPSAAENGEVVTSLDDSLQASRNSHDRCSEWLSDVKCARNKNCRSFLSSYSTSYKFLPVVATCYNEFMNS